jgi:hypothetical protein
MDRAADFACASPMRFGKEVPGRRNVATPLINAFSGARLGVLRLA